MTLDQWLKRKKMSERVFSALVDDTCTQSLVSKWRRGVVLPGPDRQAQIMTITGGAVSAKGMERLYERIKAARAKEAP